MEKKIADIESSAPLTYDGQTRDFIIAPTPWYKDLMTVLMTGFLSAVVIFGGGSLIALCFTQNVGEIFGIILGFVALTLMGILIKYWISK